MLVVNLLVFFLTIYQMHDISELCTSSGIPNKRTCSENSMFPSSGNGRGMLLIWVRNKELCTITVSKHRSQIGFIVETACILVGTSGAFISICVVHTSSYTPRFEFIKTILLPVKAVKLFLQIKHLVVAVLFQYLLLFEDLDFRTVLTQRASWPSLATF